MNNEIYIKAINLGLLGDTKVGKTSICNSFMKKDFSEDIPETIGNEKLKTKFTLSNGNEIKLIIHDTSGQERFRKISLSPTNYLRGLILVFDVTNKSSFKNLELWLEDIKTIITCDLIILLGNKVDKPKEQWEVTTDEAKAFAEKYKLIYFETSAKTKQGINEAFSYVANEGYKKFNNINNDNIDINKPFTGTTPCIPNHRANRYKKKKK